MRETSLRHNKATGQDIAEIWEVRQDFTRLGKPLHIFAFGFSRQDALNKFEEAKYYADQPDAQPFKALFDVLWAFAGEVDILMKLLGRIHK